MWLTSYDIDRGWGPIEASLVGEASIGVRTDWAWVVLDPPLVVMVSPDPGSSWEHGTKGTRSGRSPSGGRFMYVCLPESDGETSSHFTREDVAIQTGDCSISPASGLKSTSTDPLRPAHLSARPRRSRHETALAVVVQGRASEVW